MQKEHYIKHIINTYVPNASRHWYLPFTFITLKKWLADCPLWLFTYWTTEVVRGLTAAAAAPTYQITTRAQVPFLLLHPTFKVVFTLPKLLTV